MLTNAKQISFYISNHWFKFFFIMKLKLFLASKIRCIAENKKYRRTNICVFNVSGFKMKTLKFKFTTEYGYAQISRFFINEIYKKQI